MQAYFESFIKWKRQCGLTQTTMRRKVRLVMIIVIVIAAKNIAGPASIYYHRSNNTSHASRKICAPWGVSFFMGSVYA